MHIVMTLRRLSAAAGALALRRAKDDGQGADISLIKVVIGGRVPPITPNAEGHDAITR